MVRKRQGETMSKKSAEEELEDEISAVSQADAELAEAVEEADLESTPTKSRRKIDLVVDEVMRGEWGTGQARRLRLSQAGIDHREVQAEVVRRMNQQ